MTARRTPGHGAPDTPHNRSCSREASIIRSSSFSSQSDPAALVIGVHPQRAAVRVAPNGELDLFNAAVLQAQLDELRTAGFAHVVLDLRKLTFMDSSGVRLIFREDRRARSAGHRFSLIAGNPQVQRVLSVCGLMERLDFGGAAAPAPLKRLVSPRPAGGVRPTLGIAFQSYVAQLRRQGRAASRVGPRGVGRPQPR